MVRKQEKWKNEYKLRNEDGIETGLLTGYQQRMNQKRKGKKVGKIIKIVGDYNSLERQTE